MGRAPEQVRGAPGDIDAHADIYARFRRGAPELLTGRAWPGEVALAVAAALDGRSAGSARRLCPTRSPTP
jgi:hypothetical protein